MLVALICTDRAQSLRREISDGYLEGPSLLCFSLLVIRRDGTKQRTASAGRGAIDSLGNLWWHSWGSKPMCFAFAFGARTRWDKTETCSSNDNSDAYCASALGITYGLA